MIEQKALICKCCGGTINPRTMKCEYCDTSYRRHVDGIIEVRRPGEDCLTTAFAIDRHNKQNLERFVGQPITDAQWELFKKVSDIVKKCPPNCKVEWRRRTNRQGIMYYYYYYPEYVKKEVKD